MSFDLALFDLISPYVLLGDSFGAWHAALSVIYVDEHTIAVDDAGGVVIRGVARFSATGGAYIDPSNMTFGVHAENTEGHPANDPGRRDPWLDIRDAHIDFQLTAPSIASQKVVAAVTAIGPAPAFQPTANVLAAYDANPTDPPPSDYASTEFALDMLLTTILLRPPFLRPARLQPDGLMVEDTTKANVTFTLPKIKVRLAQGSNPNDPLTVTLLSAGAAALDATEDLGVAQLVTMDPPYAFIGSSKVVGFGFRSATLDLSDGSTPPDVLAQFGFDEAWTGLYLPEIRLFIAPHGADDFAVDAGARNLLIGIGASAGVTGDFDVEVINQGSGQLSLGARFYADDNRSFAITGTGDNTARVALPPSSRMIVDIGGGLPPYQSSAAIGGAGAANGRVFDIDLSAQTEMTIVVTASDAKTPPNQKTLTITATRLPVAAPAVPGTATPGDIPGAALETTSITQNGSLIGAPRLVKVTETSSSVTIALEGTPPPSAHWTVDGADRGAATSLQLDLPPGATVNVRAEASTAVPQGEFTAYYRFDYPEAGTDTQVRAYAQITDGPGQQRSTNTVAAADQGLTAPWPGGTDAGAGIAPLLASLPDGTNITVKGYASFEQGGEQARIYNTDLARRRAVGLAGIIDAKRGAKTFNVAPSADMTRWNATDQGNPVRNQFWKAVASWPAQTMPATITEGRVSRGQPRGSTTPGTPGTLPDDPRAATPPPPPSWFKAVGAKVRIVRNQFVACEVFGKFDIETPTENRLRQGGVSNADMPAIRRLGNNPTDGVIDIRIVVQIDDATDTVTVTGYLGADPADTDGLMMTGSLPNEPLAPRSLGRNYLGMAVMFMPLLSAAADAVASEGALTEIAVTGAAMTVPLTLGSLPQITVERVVWYGGELKVQVRPDGSQGVLLLDMESAVSMDIAIGSFTLIRIRRENPLTVRYKAVGLLVGNPPGVSPFQFRPVFDASKGYTIDVSRPGAIEVAEPLGQVLKILGARIARNNPLIFEIDLGFAIDLGVVSIERARVRMPLDPVGPPQLTAFAAGINIPGALKGRGYLEMGSRMVDGHQVSEIKGQIDVTILPVQVRIAAGLGIAHIEPDQTGVIVTLDVEFPVAIPLANSGLGIYGFLGLFAMNYSRDESKGTPATGMAPALAWLRATGGDPTRIDFWKPEINTWAFGVGALLGTMGSSIIFNLKGVFLLELPGPRLLLMMKANILIPMPERKGNAEGVFLAVIDLDFGRGTLTIGLAIDFNIDPLLRLTIPVEAFFNFNNTSDWHLFVGQYINPVRAKVLQIFDATGYLMLSGQGFDGSNTSPNLPAVTGFAVAAGLHVSFTWGGGPLYARLSAGFDAIIGFSPFRMAGIFTVRGTLHLFILDISAWADLTVDIGERVNPDGSREKLSRISGEICGRVEFLFFSIEGCVGFSLGDSAGPIPEPPPLLEALKLISRSPALVQGTGVDKPIDSGLGDAVAGGDAAPADLPEVPIDAIPTLLMHQPPLQDGALKFFAPGAPVAGQAIGGTPEAPADGWVQRGDVWFKYNLKRVELIGAPLTAGATPATWWKPRTDSKAAGAQLALLSWVPEATPKALGSSKFLDEYIHEHWGTTCHRAADAAPVFWSFLRERLGPSVVGWNLTGTPWPDAAQTIRSGPPDVMLRVTERWRCGDEDADRLRGILPAQVEGFAVPCGDHQLNPLRPGGHGGLVNPLLRGDNPIAAIRGDNDVEALPAAGLSYTDLVQRVASGQPVSRGEFLSVESRATNPNAPGAAAPGCFAKALAAPLFDDGELVAIGSPDFEQEVKEAWAQRDFNPGPLDDAVVVHTGEFEYAAFYLFVPRTLAVSDAIMVAASDAKDNFGDRVVVTVNDEIPPASLPGTWVDPDGPWYHDVYLLQELAARNDYYVGVFVLVKGGDGFDRVQIGALPESRKLRLKVGLKPFYVAGIEVVRRGEVIRHDYDHSEQIKKQGVLTDALGLASADNALLAANQAYRVRVTYDVARERRPAGGGAATDKVTHNDLTQSFWFRTDDQPPARLDPWILFAAPADGERHVFAAEPVKLVFATNNLNLLYDAYGKKLQARLRPSSFRSVTPPPGIAHPYALDASTLAPVKGEVFSPWEQAMTDLVLEELPCIPIAVDRVRHTQVTIPIPLDLYTDYVLDIEMLDKAAPDGSPGVRVYRESFSTGGFHTLATFAENFMTVRLGHRGVHAGDVGKLQAMGLKYAARDPQGAEFDADWQAAGMDALPAPDAPRTIIFWEPGPGAPQPVALLVDSTEPMFRSRLIPEEVADGGLAAARRFELVSRPWLEVVERAAGGAVVDQIVPAPGGQRALITLKPGARGRQLRLALRRIAYAKAHLDGTGAADTFAPIFDLLLDHAPWEEVD